MNTTIKEVPIIFFCTFFCLNTNYAVAVDWSNEPFCATPMPTAISRSAQTTLKENRIELPSIIQHIDDSVLYEATYDSSNWSGELSAYPLSATSVDTANPAWQASSVVPHWEDRNIYFINSDGLLAAFAENGELVATIVANQAEIDAATAEALQLWNECFGPPFNQSKCWEAADYPIPSPQYQDIYEKAATDLDFINIGGNVGQGKMIVNYIRGNRAGENNVTKRVRATNNVLGDFIHTNIYVPGKYEVYIGGNDGMFHAFNARTGEEQFAYIPSVFLTRLQHLMDPSYDDGGPADHQYFVDGKISTHFEKVLVTLGRGEKGFFLIRKANPTPHFDRFTKADYVWEYFEGTTDPDLGHMMGESRSIGDYANNTFIISNGYKSTNNKAVLYVFQASSTSGTYSLVKKIDTGVGDASNPNGLASPVVFEENGNRYAYAGDLLGNIWKFDLSGPPSGWKSAIEVSGVPKPLFTAKRTSGVPQPITSGIYTMVNNVASDPNVGKRFVFFGTGSYFKNGDLNDTNVQTWYGLIDDGSQINNRDNLVARSIANTGTISGKSVRNFSSGNEAEMAGKDGWYLDFPAGERIVSSPQYMPIITPLLVVNSLVPNSNDCNWSGYMNAVSPFTGANPDKHIFDINGDDEFEDKLSGAVVSSIDLNVGAPGKPTIAHTSLVASGSNGVATIKLNMGIKKSRNAWREIRQWPY